MNQCYTIAENTEEYLLQRGIDKKKYFPRYLAIAKRVWQDIFRNTLWVTKSQWLPVKYEDPHYYIDVPKDLERLFSVNEVNHCDNIVTLFYNPQMNVIPKPKNNSCGCEKCNCDGFCNELNGMTTLTKELFTVNNVTYYEKTWLQVCKNGDILEWRQVPTKKYNSYTGDGGDYNDDYNNDYDIGSPPLSDFTIITETFQKKICKLDVKECGCPKDTEENVKLINACCTGFFPFLNTRKKLSCDQYFKDVNSNHRGEVKLSECGTRIYYRPQIRRPDGQPVKIPKHLLLEYQTNGLNIDQSVLIPEYCINAMFSGLDYRSKKFNNVYTLAEKESARIDYIREVNDVIAYLNPLSLEFISTVQDTPQRW